MTEAIIVRNGEGITPFDIVGEQITVLASGARTGSYEIFHQAGPEGSGPPPHSHPWDEAFYVLSGEIAFGVEGSDTVGAAGTLVHVPAGTSHWFRFGAGGGAMLSVTSREAASHFFAECHDSLDAKEPDLGKLIEIGAKHEVALG
jgi:quercetin dioxygenase-like cupin family protein